MVRVVNGSCNTFHCQSGAGEHDLSNDMMEPKISTSWKLVGGFKDFLFSPLLGEMIQFDLYFSTELKPPTSKHMKTTKCGVFGWNKDEQKLTLGICPAFFIVHSFAGQWIAFSPEMYVFEKVLWSGSLDSFLELAMMGMFRSWIMRYVIYVL